MSRDNPLALEAVETRAHREAVCRVCGETSQRTRAFRELIADDSPHLTPEMTMTQARAALWLVVARAADLWQPDMTHDACKETTNG